MARRVIEGQIGMFVGKEFGPGGDIVPLFHAEGDVFALAFPMGTQIGVKHGVALLVEMLGDLCELPGRPGTETVDRHYETDGVFRFQQFRS